MSKETYTSVIHVVNTSRERHVVYLLHIYYIWLHSEINVRTVEYRRTHFFFLHSEINVRTVEYRRTHFKIKEHILKRKKVLLIRAILFRWHAVLIV